MGRVITETERKVEDRLSDERDALICAIYKFTDQVEELNEMEREQLEKLFEGLARRFGDGFL